jgi:outer membrane protein OmpA-like peptidoglycan-associated protein
MKKAIILFTVLLVLWITGCAYCYVCNIRNDCRAVPAAADSELVKEKPDTASPAIAKAVVPRILNLYFDFNREKVLLSGDDKKQIDEFKKYLSENPGTVISVTGHSDRVGSERSKILMSTMRAQYAREQLLAAGIEDARISVSGKSDSEPASSENTPEGNAKNRRAEIQIK